MDRRTFLTTTGAGAAGALLPGCTSRQKAPASDGQMEIRVNPGNGDRVGLLGYGCMRWPTVKDSAGRDVIDQEKVNALVDHAIAHGVNYFDTSPVYLQGESEKATGIALSRHPRSSYLIATKLSNFGVADREKSLQMYRASFEQLQTSWFDYYLLHAIGRGGYEAFRSRYEDNGMMDFLLAEREAGRIRQLGFSFHGSRPQFDEMIALHEKYHWDFVQIEMNYVDWKHADGVRNVNADYLYAELDRRGLPIVVMEPLLGGRLAKPPGNVAARLKERDPDASLASWAFRFVGSFPRILTILSGMTYMEHLEDNLRTFCGFRPLSGEELQLMERMAVLMKEYPTVNCTNCKYCMPCPYGINIPAIFRHYNHCINEGLAPQSAAQADFRRLRRAYLVSYGQAVPPERQADHCIGCGRCKVHCPQSIDIPHELHRIDQYIERLRRETL